MACSTITIADIYEKLSACASLLEAGQYQQAIVKATAGLALISARPDQEFDDQRMEWRKAAENFELLLKSARDLKAEAKFANGAGGLQRIPVRRSCPTDC